MIKELCECLHNNTVHRKTIHKRPLEKVYYYSCEIKNCKCARFKKK